VQVTNNYCLIKCVKPKYETQGGLELPGTMRKVSRWGIILSVGEGLADMNGMVAPPPFEVGDLVYFHQHGPEKMDYSNESTEIGMLHVIGEGDILFTLKVSAEDGAKIIPCGNLLHIQPIEESVAKVSPGGIILPDQVIERPSKARVIAVGRGQRTVGGYYPPKVNPGDIVRYRNQAILSVKFDDVGIRDKETFLVAYGDVVAVETEGYLEEIKEKLEKARCSLLNDVVLL
jgi:chaperonin GroES